MKPFSLPFLLTPITGCFLVTSYLLVNGCLKDHCSHHTQYKIYAPEYISQAQARDVGIETARPLEKTGKIFYHDGYLLIGELNEGIHVIDDRDPSAPRNVGFLRIPGNLDMTVSGETLYADNYLDLVSFDISDPTQAREVARVENAFPVRNYGYGLQDDPEGKGLIAGFDVRDTTIDQACPAKEDNTAVIYDNQAVYLSLANASAAPSPVNIGGSTSRLALEGHFLYAVQGSKMSLFDIGNQKQPSYVKDIDVASEVETIFSYGSRLFIGSTTGVAIFDASDPEQPVQLGWFTHFIACDPVVVQGDYAYATLKTGSNCNAQGVVNSLIVEDISDVSDPRLAGELRLTGPEGLAVRGTTAIVTDGAAGVHFVDVSDPKHPAIRYTEGAPKNPSDVVVTDDTTAIVIAADGLYQYRFKNGKAPRLLSRFGTSSK